MTMTDTDRPVLDLPGLRLPAPRSAGEVRSGGAVRSRATPGPTPRGPAPRGPAPTGPARSAPARPVQRRAAPPPRSALGLLRQAGAGLAEAHREEDPLLRYPAAYLAALRAAAAVLAVRAAPAPRRGTRNVWLLLARVAPELGEWAAFFASCSDTRAAAEAGIHRLVRRRDADDLLRQAEQFVTLVGASLPLR